MSRRKIRASTSSLGPNAASFPSFIMRTRSQPSSALGRCATMKTMPPRRRTASDSRGKRRLALSVQIGIRFIENDKEGILIKSSRQRDTLPLTGRQHRAAWADLGFIPLWETQDHIMHTGDFGSGNHRRRFRRVLKAGDVFGHRAGEELDILWEVADMGTEITVIPLVQRSAVEADRAAVGWPDAGHGARKR